MRHKGYPKKMGLAGQSVSLVEVDGFFAGDWVRIKGLNGVSRIACFDNYTNCAILETKMGDKWYWQLKDLVRIDTILEGFDIHELS